MALDSILLQNENIIFKFNNIIFAFLFHNEDIWQLVCYPKDGFVAILRYSLIKLWHEDGQGHNQDS